MTTDADEGVAGLLTPGAERGYAVAGDHALLAAILRAESAWVDVLEAAGSAPPDLPAALTAALRSEPPDLASVLRRSEAVGNPVIPVVEDLRARVGGGDAGRFVHRGLTSQDVLDTALMLVAADALDAVGRALARTGDALADSAEKHRGTVMLGRTLTQHAVPITFGLKAAQWLAGVHDSLDDVRRCRAELPLQCGGAAGTLAGAALAAATRVTTESRNTAPPTTADLADRWGKELGLVAPTVPWHTRRRPVTRLADCLAGAVSAVSHIATDVVTLARPEVGELAEGGGEGKGRSSTMPHKRNPVLAVLVRAAGLQAGPLAGLLHQCAALAVDERSDGAWHAEWPTLQHLLVLSVSATDQAARLAEGLTVHANAMADRVESAGRLVLAEWQGLAYELPAAPQPADDTTAGDYLGAAPALVDEVVRRWRGRAGR